MYDINGNNCSWRLYWDDAAGAYTFAVNNTGNPANDIIVASTHAVDHTKWMFVGGFYHPSTTHRIYVAYAEETELSTDDNAVGIPAALFNGTSPLAVGSAFNNAVTVHEPFDGDISIGNMRIRTTATAATTIDAYFNRPFQITRRFYLE